jgi:hypothetical protein
MGVAVSFIVLVFKCCCCKTKWLESTIAWISISEIVAWAGLLYYYYYLETDLIHIITMAGACGMHVLLNIIYSLVHQKLVFKEGGALYKQLIMNYHCWNTLAIVIAFFFSFKFHIIQMSHFWNATALSGEWPKEVWGVWNMLCITYLISCYPILLGSSGYFAYKNMDKIDEWVFWGTIDVVALSTYVAFLLIISACC